MRDLTLPVMAMGGGVRGERNPETGGERVDEKVTYAGEKNR